MTSNNHVYGPHQEGRGALIRDPRVRILFAVAEARVLSITDLAATCGVTKTTATYHVARLVAEQRLTCQRVQRCVLVRVSDVEMADRLRCLRGGDAGVDLDVARRDRAARMCHRHVAGRLGVALLDALLERRYLLRREPGYALTVAGSRALRALGVYLPRPGHDRHPPAYACFDRTEHRSHLAGHYARQLAARLFALRWLEKDGRIVTVTADGREGLRDRSGLPWAPA